MCAIIINYKEPKVENELDQINHSKADSLQKETDSGESSTTSKSEESSDEELKELEEQYIYEEDFLSDVSNDSSCSTLVQVTDDTVCKSSRIQELSSDSCSSIKTNDETSSNHYIKYKCSDITIEEERIQTPPSDTYDTFSSKKSHSLLLKRSKFISFFLLF